MALNIPLTTISPDLDKRTGFDMINQNFILVSNLKTFEYADSGSFTLTVGSCSNGASVTATKTVTHNLGYKPIVLAFAQYSTDEQNIFGVPIVTSSGISGGNVVITKLEEQKITSTATSITFDLSLYNNTGSTINSYDVLVKYYLISEEAPK